MVPVSDIYRPIARKIDSELREIHLSSTGKVWINNLEMIMYTAKKSLWSNLLRSICEVDGYSRLLKVDERIVSLTLHDIH